MSKAVVYIDDEPALCRVLQMILGIRGIPIATFTDPLAALAYIHANDVAVVICDYRMPTMSGLEVLSRLGRAIPFYLVSGDLGATDAASVPGVTGMLAKPFPPEALIAIVERYTPPEPG